MQISRELLEEMERFLLIEEVSITYDDRRPEKFCKHCFATAFDADEVKHKNDCIYLQLLTKIQNNLMI